MRRRSEAAQSAGSEVKLRSVPPSLAVMVLIVSLAPGAAAVDLLDLESAGILSPAEQYEARRISELFFLDGILYLGTGDAVVNTGPTPILAWDPATGDLRTEFTVEDEAIYRYCTVDGMPAIPGPDATESWELGNVYVREQDGWRKHRTLPLAVHVNDIVSFDGAWYATTGTVLELGTGNQLAAGSILVSKDRGETWTPDYITSASPSAVVRVDLLASFGGRLYAFPYAMADYPETEVPEAVRAVSGSEVLGNEKGMHTLYVPDPQGPAESLVRTAQGWQPADLVPAGEVCRVRPILFSDRLLLAVTTGARVAPFASTVLDGPVPVPGAMTHLFAFDGGRTERIPIEVDQIRDSVVRDGRLSLLVLRGGHYWIAETEDLSAWGWRALPLDRANPLSLEREGGGVYIGTKDGNLLRGGREPVRLGGAEEIGDRDVASFTLRGELPREARAYWGAITRWARPGWTARATFTLTTDRQVRIDADGVAELYVFLPAALRGGRGAQLVIDGSAVAVAPGQGDTLICSRADGGAWSVRRVESPGAGWPPPAQVVGEAPMDLAQDDGLLARWVTEAIRTAAGADVAFAAQSGIRKGIAKGPLAAEDLHDLAYRDRIAVLRLSGDRVRALLEANRARDARQRCAFAGFEAELDGAAGKVVSCSLDPSRIYTVAMPAYTAANGTRFFDGDLGEHATAPGYVHTAMIQHLLEQPGSLGR